MKKYRVCQLDGCDIWCVQQLRQPRWLFRWFVEPRWMQTRRFSVFEPCYSEPEEFASQLDAIVRMEQLEKREREAAARATESWRCME